MPIRHQKCAARNKDQFRKFIKYDFTLHIFINASKKNKMNNKEDDEYKKYLGEFMSSKHKLFDRDISLCLNLRMRSRAVSIGRV